MFTARQPDVHPALDPDTETYQLKYDSGSRWEASTTLVLALSSLVGEDPTEMRPLNQVIDPDVINRHVRARNHGNEIAFTYHEHRVTVRSDGQIRFAPLADERTAVSN